MLLWIALHVSGRAMAAGCIQRQLDGVTPHVLRDNIFMQFYNKFAAHDAIFTSFELQFLWGFFFAHVQTYNAPTNGFDRIKLHLIDWVTQLEEAGIGFKSLQESIDTTTSSGKLVFHIFAALAEFERNLIRERTNAGLAAARARGRLGGRRKSLDAKDRKRAVDMYERKNQTVKQICEMMNITKPTLYAYVREEQATQKAET